MSSKPPTTFYKRATFVTHLPESYLYHPAHFWIARCEPGAARWRVGYTKFATRMLGEIVDHQFEKSPGDAVACGEIIGSIEGFKAISDLYCVGQGSFAGGNATLRGKIELVGEDPYGEGWLYEIDGEPDGKCVDIHAYCRMLDTTIDRLLAKQKNDDSFS